MSDDLILQVKIPFCARRCAHCRVPTCRYRPEWTAAFAKALLSEIDAVAPDLEDYTVSAVSVEGGSPALMAAADLQAVLRAIRRRFRLAGDAQISLQTMPGDYSRSLMERMRDNGVNFWIVGLETADPEEHELLRRPYRFDALTMVDAAIRTFNPRDLSFDLLYGIPGQSMKSWSHTLDTVLAYAPEHLTLLPLQLIKGTALCAQVDEGLVTPPDPALARDMRDHARDRLAALGYRAYTRMDYALPGKEYRYRRGQMEGMPQLGIGYRSRTVMDGFAYTNGHTLQEYLEHPGDLQILADEVTALEGEALAAYDRAREQMRPEESNS